MWPLKKLEFCTHKIFVMKVLVLVESGNLHTNVVTHNNLTDKSVATVVNNPMEVKTQERRGSSLARLGM